MTIDLVADATIAKSAILSIGGCVASKVCKSFHDQLAQANLVHRPVDGDNNCGFYSVGVSLAASTIEHTPGGTATARDKQWALQQRDKCYAWLSADEQAAYRQGAIVFKPNGGYACELDSSAAKIKAFTCYPAWAGTHVLRALAALECVDIISVRSDKLTPNVSFYPADGAVALQVLCSWSSDILPRLARQQRGDEPKRVRVKVAQKGGQGFERVLMPERWLVVVVWNGQDHYDGTCLRG